MPKKPTQAQFEVAALWLENNEGEEAGDCKAVADWIKQLIDNDNIRLVAREGGVPVASLRRKIAEQTS